MFQVLGIKHIEVGGTDFDGTCPRSSSDAHHELRCSFIVSGGRHDSRLSVAHHPQPSRPSPLRSNARCAAPPSPPPHPIFLTPRPLLPREARCFLDDVASRSKILSKTVQSRLTTLSNTVYSMAWRLNPPFLTLSTPSGLIRSRFLRSSKP